MRNAPRSAGFMHLLVILVIVVTVILVMMGCGYVPESGKVVEKQHDSFSLIYCGKGCWMPDDEDWLLCLEDAQGVGCREVPADVWTKYEKGDQYP